MRRILQNRCMSECIYKRHNISSLLYHLVRLTKYQRLVINDNVDKLIKDISLEIEKGYELHFIKIRTDKDYEHFIVQAVPILTVTRIVTIKKSITVRKVIDTKPELKIALWGLSPRTSGCCAAAIGKYGNETTIGNYIKEQGCAIERVKIHKDLLRLL